MAKEKVAFFDFCETIANFQTADKYVHFTRRYYGKFTSRVLYSLYVLMYNKGIIQKLTIKFPNSSINKRLILFQLLGFTKKQLEYTAKLYYNQEVKPNFIPGVIEKLKALQNLGYKIVIVSGGYGIYLKFFAEEFGISQVFSSKIKFFHGICCGVMDGKDCIRMEKTRILNKYYSKNSLGYTIAFSDSISDLPLLRWTDDAVVIRRSDRQRWSEEFQEMIWEK